MTAHFSFLSLTRIQIRAQMLWNNFSIARDIAVNGSTSRILTVGPFTRLFVVKFLSAIHNRLHACSLSVRGTSPSIFSRFMCERLHRAFYFLPFKQLFIGIIASPNQQKKVAQLNGRRYNPIQYGFRLNLQCEYKFHVSSYRWRHLSLVYMK